MKIFNIWIYLLMRLFVFLTLGLFWVYDQVICVSESQHKLLDALSRSSSCSAQSHPLTPGRPPWSVCFHSCVVFSLPYRGSLLCWKAWTWGPAQANGQWITWAGLGARKRWRFTSLPSHRWTSLVRTLCIGIFFWGYSGDPFLNLWKYFYIII